jgi:hypothetical protein
MQLEAELRQARYDMPCILLCTDLTCGNALHRPGHLPVSQILSLSQPQVAKLLQQKD